MAELKVNRRPLRKTPTGDRRDRISIRQRDVSAPDFDDPAKFEEIYKTLVVVWAMVKTNVSGRKFFDGVNEDTGGGVILSSTHVFNIRYRDGMTAQNVVTYKGENYKINRIVNFEERNIELDLHCKVLGDRELEANE